MIHSTDLRPSLTTSAREELIDWLSRRRHVPIFSVSTLSELARVPTFEPLTSNSIVLYRSCTSFNERNTLRVSEGALVPLHYSTQSSWTYDPDIAALFKTSRGGSYTVKAVVPIGSVVIDTTQLSSAYLEVELGSDPQEQEVILHPGTYSVQEFDPSLDCTYRR